MSYTFLVHDISYSSVVGFLKLYFRQWLLLVIFNMNGICDMAGAAYLSNLLMSV